MSARNGPNVFVAALFAAALAFSLGLAATRTLPFPARAFLYDFRAFACAGKAVSQGADPYRAEPLRTCEHAAGAFRADLARLVVPAPLPGFALAPFVALARLPFDVAAALWLALSAAAFVAAALALTALAGIRARVVWTALALSCGFISLLLGQIVTVALAGLVLGALAIERRRDALAVVPLAVAALEVHLAVPAFLALAIFVPRARLAIAVAALLGAALSLGVLGPAVNLEYVRAVLPAHAASEIANEEQYSLAYLLHVLGAGDALALRASDLWYVASVFAGIATARILVDRGAPRALLVLVPPAFAVIGGPYVHIHQMAFALPAALVLFGRVAPRSRALGAAIVLLAVPWGDFGELLATAPLVAFVVALLAHDLLGFKPATAGALGACAAGFIVLLMLGLVPRPESAAVLAPFADGRLLPEVSWTAYIRAAYHANALIFALAKVPTLLGLGSFVAVALRAAQMQRERLAIRAA